MRKRETWHERATRGANVVSSDLATLYKRWFAASHLEPVYPTTASAAPDVWLVVRPAGRVFTA